jgi:chromosome segregation ATPase
MIAMELHPSENKVDIWAFPEELATEEFAQKMLDEWRNGKEVTFPEGTVHHERSLSASESLLPETLQAFKPDLLERTRTEWSFLVLSSKAHQSYEAEVRDFKEKIDGLTEFSNSLWEEVKSFWDRVREQMRERNLSREHADRLRDATNELFAQMKEKRSGGDTEFIELAKSNFKKITAVLDSVDERLEQANPDLYKLFEELKSLQREFRNARLNREMKNKLWTRIDDVFKAVKDRRHGGNGVTNSTNTNGGGASRRVEGLHSAIEKMEISIKRDKEELEFQSKKINSGNASQLETQLREAKAKVFHERIRSKEDKLNNMKSTLEDLLKGGNPSKLKDIEDDIEDSNDYADKL